MYPIRSGEHVSVRRQLSGNEAIHSMIDAALKPLNLKKITELTATGPERFEIAAQNSFPQIMLNVTRSIQSPTRGIFALCPTESNQSAFLTRTFLIGPTI